MEQDWIMVMNRHKTMDKEFGMEMSFSITKLGVKEAVEKAIEFKEASEKLYSNLEYKIQGGRW